MNQSGGRLEWELLLACGAAVLYVVTRWLIAVLGGSDGSATGRQAVAQWLPIMAVAFAAMGFGQPRMALALVFGSSVACLSLVLGMTTYSAPIETLGPQRRLWALVVPPAMLVLLAGFHGSWTWYHAIMLLLMGAAIIPVWLDHRGPGDEPQQASSPPQPAAPVETLAYSSEPAPSSSAKALRVTWLIPAIILLGLGVWAMQGAAMHAASRALTPSLLAATILSPLVVLPTLGAGTLLAHRGHADRVVTALCGTVQLNLCLLLPVLILGGDVICALNKKAAPLPFPAVTWRVDAVLLLILAAALIPIAAGRWIPRRAESIVLVIVYGAYLVAETSVSVGLLG